MPSSSIANDPSPSPNADVRYHVLWAVGKPGSGWEHYPSFVAAFNDEVVEHHPLDFEEQRQAAERDFTRLADVDDPFFFLEPMVCDLPRLPTDYTTAGTAG